MLKKFIAVLLAVLTCFFACGCSALFEDEYSSETPHETDEDSEDISENTIFVENYAGLERALQSFIGERVQNGKIRFDTYSGNVESDVETACMEAANATPMGLFAVYYINFTVNKIVSYYEADISITYKRTAKEIQSIKYAQDIEEATSLIQETVKKRGDKLIIKLELEEAGEDAIKNIVEEIYYSDPDEVVYIPGVTVESFPEEGKERIIQMSFTYQYIDMIMEQRSEAIVQSAEDILRDLTQESEYEKLEYICKSLYEHVQYDTAAEGIDNYDRRENSYTAYGALVLGHAAGEGYAMSFKVLCDKMGISCRVVRGRLNGVTYAWNMVTMGDGKNYHVDVCRFEPGGRILKSDGEMTEGYWWDTVKYPVCSTAWPLYEVPSQSE